MSNLDQVWGSVSADSENEDNVTPPPGTYVVRIAGTRAGTSKRGEQYFAVDLKDDGQGHKWMIYKAFTKNGQPHEGSIKSAKITLRQLGLDVQSPAHLEQVLGSIVGRYYAVEVKASDRINQVTGMPYLNTDVTGPASAPTLNVAPAPQVQAPQFQPAQSGAELQDQFAQAQQHNAQVAQPMGALAAAPHAALARTADAMGVQLDPNTTAGAMQAQAPAGETLDQAVQAGAVFPSAVPGQAPTVVQQQPGAQFGEKAPF